MNTGQSNKALHQVINLDEQGTATNTSPQQDQFIAGLASQCANLLNWTAQPTISTELQQTVWKNQMSIKASELYPELDNDEIKKIIDRDWKIMSEENRNTIIKKYSTVPDPNALKNRAKELHQRLQCIRDSMNQVQ